MVGWNPVSRMKLSAMVLRAMLGAALALWLVLLIVFATSLVLFFAGLILPAVNVQTILESWGWAALMLTVAVLGWAVKQGRQRRLFARSALRGYTWATLFIISLVVLFYVVERWRGYHAWQRLETELRAEPLELRDLAPFPVPKEDNLAALPLIEQWWHEPANERDDTAWHRLAGRVPDRGDGAWEVQLPVDLGECLRYYLPSALSAEAPEMISAARFLAAWNIFAPEMEQLRAGAERRYARFELPYDRGMFDDTLGGKLELFMAIGQVFRLHAVALLTDRNASRALEDVEQLGRLSDIVGQEPLLERQRLALLLATLQPIWEGITCRRWSDAQLARLQADLARPGLLREQQQAVRKEYLLLTDLCEKLFPIRSQQPASDIAGDAPDHMLITGMRLVYPSGWLFQDLVGLHRLSREIRRQSASPAEHRVYLDVTRRLLRAGLQPPPSLDPFFAVFILPRAHEIAEDTTQRYAYAQNALDLAATACAIERYRLARRQLPDRLDQLLPDWIERVPMDVMDGRPLRYRRLDSGGYRLYSVGWNLTDDGGRVAARSRPADAWEDSVLDKDEGDWVWQTAGD